VTYGCHVTMVLSVAQVDWMNGVSQSFVLTVLFMALFCILYKSKGQDLILAHSILFFCIEFSVVYYWQFDFCMLNTQCKCFTAMAPFLKTSMPCDFWCKEQPKSLNIKFSTSPSYSISQPQSHVINHIITALCSSRAENSAFNAPIW